MNLAIITGTSRGLGKEFLNFFSNRENYRIISFSRSEDTEEIENRVEHVCMDLTEIHSANFLKDLITEEYETILYINNAASVEPIGKIGKLDESEIARSLRINSLVPMLFANELFKLHFDQLSIINITTGAAKRPIEALGMYCATKAAIRMFFDVLTEQEKNNSKIKVFNIDPGVIDTKMQEVIRNSGEEDFPDIGYFKSLKSNDKLLSPLESAKNVLRSTGLFPDV